MKVTLEISFETDRTLPHKTKEQVAADIAAEIIYGEFGLAWDCITVKADNIPVKEEIIREQFDAHPWLASDDNAVFGPNC